MTSSRHWFWKWRSVWLTRHIHTAQPWCADFLQYIDRVQAPLPPGMSTIQWWGVRVYLSKVLLWLLILLLWQLNSSCYHAAWSALAQDYLLIMSSSVSSKHCGCAGSTSHLGLSRHLPYVDTSHMLYPLSVDHHLLWGFPPCLGLGPSQHAFSQGGISISKWCNQLKGDIIEALQVVKCAICNDLLLDPGPSSITEVEEVDGDSGGGCIQKHGWGGAGLVWYFTWGDEDDFMPNNIEEDNDEDYL